MLGSALQAKDVGFRASDRSIVGLVVYGAWETPGFASDVPYLWLVGNGGMGYNYNYYDYHSSIPY